MIALENAYLKGRESYRINDVSLELYSGEVLALLGPNGAGKSSLLKLMSAEIACDKGRVLLDGVPMQCFDSKAIALRRAVLPQESALAFNFKVIDVVLMGRSPHKGCGKQVDDDAVRWAMHTTGTTDFAHRDYTSLSGGERQRVHLARVLSQIGQESPDAKFLLLDEPTSALDLAHQHLVLSVAKDLARCYEIGVLAILHDINLAALYADRIAFLKNGSIQVVGLPEDVLKSSLIRKVFEIDVSVIDNPRHPSRSLIISG